MVPVPFPLLESYGAFGRSVNSGTGSVPSPLPRGRMVRMIGFCPVTGTPANAPSTGCGDTLVHNAGRAAQTAGRRGVEKTRSRLGDPPSRRPAGPSRMQMIRHSSYSCREYGGDGRAGSTRRRARCPMGCRPHRHGRAQPTPAARACRNWTAAASFPTRDRAKRYTRAASSRAAGYPVRSPQGAPSLATPPPAPGRPGARAPGAPRATPAWAARNPAHPPATGAAHEGRPSVIHCPRRLAGKLSCGQNGSAFGACPAHPADTTAIRMAAKDGSWARYDSVFYARVQARLSRLLKFFQILRMAKDGACNTLPHYATLFPASSPLSKGWSAEKPS